MSTRGSLILRFGRGRVVSKLLPRDAYPNGWGLDILTTILMLPDQGLLRGARALYNAGHDDWVDDSEASYIGRAATDELFGEYCYELDLTEGVFRFETGDITIPFSVIRQWNPLALRIACFFLECATSLKEFGEPLDKVDYWHWGETLAHPAATEAEEVWVDDVNRYYRADGKFVPMTWEQFFDERAASLNEGDLPF
ncbi:hypothetical protein KW797_00135 [Candidatus Parcubacteria bacterium]|nr:hypothetical protein [Candidatus Parcubacteria bacterium]